MGLSQSCPSCKGKEHWLVTASIPSEQGASGKAVHGLGFTWLESKQKYSIRSHTSGIFCWASSELFVLLGWCVSPFPKLHTIHICTLSSFEFSCKSYRYFESIQPWILQTCPAHPPKCENIKTQQHVHLHKCMRLWRGLSRVWYMELSAFSSAVALYIHGIGLELEQANPRFFCNKYFCDLLWAV